ncbi:hypothetical protein Sj15T_12380 [Sphingobium sp. TA15]|nr:hypothetical protein Sj15T_12380 [Sphingobium sp. TA15]
MSKLRSPRFDCSMTMGTRAAMGSDMISVILLFQGVLLLPVLYIGTKSGLFKGSRETRSVCPAERGAISRAGRSRKAP